MLDDIYFLEGKEGIQHTFAFEIDRNRFDKVMKKIGYALYYHTYNKVWQRGLIVATDCLLNIGLQQDEYGQLISMYRQQIIEPIFDGKNPKVFQYKFQETESEEVILWMKFYEGFEVFIILRGRMKYKMSKKLYPKIKLYYGQG